LLLARSFQHVREYPVLENEYKNGESQRSKLAATSRKRFVLSGRLAPTPLATLRAFYVARSGPHEPFYYYSPFETTPKFSYDPTNPTWAAANLAVRYTVRFEGPWEQSVGMARADVQIVLVELA